MDEARRYFRSRTLLLLELRCSLQAVDAIVGYVRLHDGRHTAGTLLAEQGVHVRTIQRILGHADVRTTEGYTHTSDLVVRDAAERMGSALWDD